MASAAVDDGNTATGTHIMVAGIIFQLASITVFVFCAVDFMARVVRRRLLQKLTGSVLPLLAATVLAVLVIYARSIYRTIELLQGWSGYLITHERYFIALDGSMMIIAVGVYNFMHPGWLLPKSHEQKNEHKDDFASEVEMNRTSDTL